MSVDRSAELIVGYVIPVEDFFKPLLVESKEVFHMEDRFDPKTGKKLDKQEKVVDRVAGFDVAVGKRVFEGPEDDTDLENFNPEDDITEAIGELLDCDVRVTGDFYNGCNIFVCLTCAKMKYEDGSASIKELVKHQEDLERIGKACKKLLKVDPGLCGAHALMFSC
jgi:hypothetical protein